MSYNKNYREKSSQEKKEEISNLIKKAETGVSNVFISQQNLREYLKFMGQFYHYSSRNMSLIQSQFHGAQAVAPFKTWKERGYSVLKGEKGIQIIVPYSKPEGFITKDNKWKAIKDATEEEKKEIKEGKRKKVREHITFGKGTVFDISQTNMPPEEYPKFFPNKPFINGNFEHYETFMNALEKVAKKMNVAVVEPRHELGSAKGAYYPFDHVISLNPRNNKLQNVTTFIHELGHARMHSKDKTFNTTTPEKEFQAEMVNYVVCHHFGIDNEQGEKEAQSLGYIYHWTKGKTIRDKAVLLDEVERTSKFLIENIEECFGKEKDKNQALHFEKGDAILFTDHDIKSVPLNKIPIQKYLNADFVKCIHLNQNISIWTHEEPLENNGTVHEIQLPVELIKDDSVLKFEGHFLFTGLDKSHKVISLSDQQLESIKKVKHKVLKSAEDEKEDKQDKEGKKILVATQIERM